MNTPIKSIDIRQSLDEDMDYSTALHQGHSPESVNTPKILERYSRFADYDYVSLFHILHKSHHARTHNQLRFLVDFIKKCSPLKHLSEINGFQFCKGIMRCATLQEYAEHQIIGSRGEQITSVYIILQGKLATIKNQDDSDMIEQIGTQDVYESLTNLSRKQIKKTSKLIKKFSSWRAEPFRIHHCCSDLQEKQFLQQFQKGEIVGDKMRCASNQYTHMTIALQKSLLISIDVRNILFWLNHSFELKLKKSFKLLRHHPCFIQFDDQMLEDIISFMVVQKRRKNDIIYEQGTEANYIYFLEEGQLKIQKESKLFVQNPNELYMDRRKLMSSRQLDNGQYLPYGNFEHLYNYRPTKKVVELGIITPFCLFGEQQILQNKPRQTTIKCESIHTVYYSVQLKKIYQILGDKFPNFLSVIKNSIKDKIRYRQNSYATTINLENKYNLNYFYYDGEGTLPTPRKYVIKKINQKINHHQNRPHSQMSTFAQATDSYEGERQDQRHQHNQVASQQDANPEATLMRSININEANKQIPPKYNTFNFHKMMNTKLVKTDFSDFKKESQSSSEQEMSRKVATGPVEQNIKQEQRIITNSHTWRLVKNKVHKESQLSKKIGSLNHNINFASPLIDEKFFRDIEGKIKKLEREKRKGKFNVSAPKRSTTAFEFSPLPSNR